jgi:hypothetical protein
MIGLQVELFINKKNRYNVRIEIILYSQIFILSTQAFKSK